MAKWTKRILLTLGILIVLILGAAILIPILFKDKIEAAVKAEVNKNINAVVDWGDWDITILKSFPDLTVEIENVKVSNVAPLKASTWRASPCSPPRWTSRASSGITSTSSVSAT